jgi:5-oxoprolinase (ATP-hydrolysing)
MDKLSTILVEPNCRFFVTKQNNIRIEVGHHLGKKIGTELDTIQLSIFSHRFMSIAGKIFSKKLPFSLA